jgi:hypothetical protein
MEFFASKFDISKADKTVRLPIHLHHGYIFYERTGHKNSCGQDLYRPFRGIVSEVTRFTHSPLFIWCRLDGEPQRVDVYGEHVYINTDYNCERTLPLWRPWVRQDGVVNKDVTAQYHH